MKAAVLTAPETVEVTTVPEPECGPHEVLVRMRGVGLCGSDLAVYRGGRSVPEIPWILGHEGVGDVVAVGAEVTGHAVGEQVAVEPNYCCLACPACRAGSTSACPNRVIVGMNHPGLLAEYVAVPAEFAWPVGSHVALDDLVCTEPLTVAQAALRRSGIAEGQECLVVGAGSQGLFLCQALLAHGVRPYVREPHDGRRELAQRLGAQVARGDVTGLPYLFETSGAPGAVAAGLPHLGAHGTAVLIGLNDAPLRVSCLDLVYRQLTLTGSLIYDHPRDFADTVGALDAGRLQPGKTLAARHRLDDAAEAFATAGAASGKVWIELGGSV